MSAERLTRRQLLASAAVAGAAATVGVGVGCGGSGDVDAHTVARDLFDDEAAARWLGDLYLRANPGERSRDALSGRLFAGGPSGSGAVDELRERIAREHRDGQVVELAGWRVARSEAVAAALVAVG